MKATLSLILLLSVMGPQVNSPLKPGAGKATKPSGKGLSGTRAGAFKRAGKQGRVDPVRASSVLHRHQVARRLRAAAIAVPDLVRVARIIYRKAPWRIVPSVLMAWAALAGTEWWDSRMVDVVEREVKCSSI